MSLVNADTSVLCRPAKTPVRRLVRNLLDGHFQDALRLVRRELTRRTGRLRSSNRSNQVSWGSDLRSPVRGPIRAGVASTASSPHFSLHQGAVRDRSEVVAQVRIDHLSVTFASVGVNSGHGLPIIGKLLEHTKTFSTQRYAHLDDDPVRWASEQTGASLQPALAERPKADAVPFEQGVR